MLVADASAIVELLRATPHGLEIEAYLFAGSEIVAAPHLLDVEVLQVLRKLDRTNRVAARRSEQMLEDLGDLAITRYDHETLRPAMWRLRHNLTMYDAAYVALAELIGARIVTCDAKLAQSTGHGAAFRLFDRSDPAAPIPPAKSGP